MKEVSGRIASQLLDGAEWLGVPAHDLAQAVGMTERDLRSPRGWISWNTVAAMTAELQQRGITKAQFELLGRQIIHLPSGALLRRLAGHMIGLRQLYLICFRWLAPSLFPVLSIHMEDLSPATTRFRLEIPDGYASSEPFFWVLSGVARVVPELMGDARAEVIATATPRSCELLIEVATGHSVARRVARLLRSMRFPSRLVAELSEHQEMLRRSYEDLRRSRREFMQVLDCVPAGIAVCRNGTILYANPELATSLSYDGPRELVGRSLAELLSEPPACVHAEESIPSKPPRAPIELVLRKADGSSAAAEVTGGGNIIFDGAPASVLLIRDVSVQRALEQDLRRADRLASLGRIAADIAHEVNNPLGYMMLNIQRLRRRWLRGGSADEAEGLRSLDAVEDGAKRIEEIVKELTSLAPRDGERAVPLDAQIIIEEAIRMASPQLPPRTAVERDFNSPALVVAQPRHLQQVMLNLLTNAAQALPQDQRAVGRITVRTVAGSDGQVIIEVEDNGEGIADEYRDRIFKPFFSTKADAKNTGLGLTISQDLLARMSGRLSFHPATERGTVFRIELPALSSETEPPQESVVSAEGDRDGSAAQPSSPSR